MSNAATVAVAGLLFAVATGIGGYGYGMYQGKALEKGRASVTEGIPEALPALLRASKVLARSEHIDVPLPQAGDPLADDGDEESLGDLLLAVVAAGRARGWDAEAALRDAVRRQALRIREREERMREAEGA